MRRGGASVFTVGADDGVAQLAYQRVRADLLDAARDNGVAVLSICDSFPVGEFGFYTADVAAEGLIALAGANATAMMSLYDVPAGLAGRNPLSSAVPARPRPRMIDQASSAAAWVAGFATPLTPGSPSQQAGPSMPTARPPPMPLRPCSDACSRSVSSRAATSP